MCNRVTLLTSTLVILGALVAFAVMAGLSAPESTAGVPGLGQPRMNQAGQLNTNELWLTTPSGVSLRLSGYEIQREGDSIFTARISAVLTNGSAQSLHVLGGLAPEQPYLHTEVARMITVCRHHFLWWDWDCYTICNLPLDEHHLTPLPIPCDSLRIAAGVTDGDTLEHAPAPADVMIAVVTSRDVQRIATALDVDTSVIVQYPPEFQPGESLAVVLQASILIVDSNLIPKPITIGVTLADDQGSSDVQVLECGLTGGCLPLTTICVTPPSGLVAWWPLDESPGAVEVQDIAGPNIGSYYGSPPPGSIIGQVDRALEFSGTTCSYVWAPRAMPQHDYRSLTIDAWIYPYTLPTGPSDWNIVGYGSNTDPWAYSLRLEGSELMFYIQASPMSHSITTTGANITPGAWYHVTATANPGTHELRVYVNGILRGLHSGSYDPTDYYTADGWLIGGRYSPSCFDGVIDEVEVFERALDASEILDIVNAGSSGKCKGCAATGDINGDGIPLSIADYVALIRFVNFGGPPPIPLYQGDLSGDGYIDQADVELYACYFTYGLSCFPQYPIPVPCGTDTVRGCCLSSIGNYVRSPANCAAIGGTYLGDGVKCPCLPPPPDMHLWLTLDEGTPGPSMNLAGPNNGIQSGSLVAVAGKVNGALQFNGSNTYVNVASYSAIDADTGDLTIDAWVMRAAGDGGVRVIADKRSDVGGYFGYQFFLYNGQMGCQLSDGGYTIYTTSTSQVVPPTGWHHVAVTVDRDNPTGLQFYLDGAPFAAPFNPTPRQGSLNSSAPFRVGAVSFSGTSVFLGAIDEVEMFSRALTAVEIKSIYDAQNVGKCPCNCPHQGDINGDGIIDVFDVIDVIGIAFSGDPDPQDPLCPKTRGDVDNNGVTDVFDAIYLIATAFSGGPDPINPCGP